MHNNLNLKSYDPAEFHSPNEMVIDTPDELAAVENEKEQVVDINPESLDPESLENNQEPRILATDRMSHSAGRKFNTKADQNSCR